MDNGNHQFQFVAGNLAVDFVNTVAYRADTDKAAERLVRADDVYRWGKQSGMTEWASAPSGPRMSAVGIRHLRETREQLFELFQAIANGDAIPADTLVRIGNTFNECSAKRRLCAGKSNVHWEWRPNARHIDQLLYPILTAALELLTSGTRGMIRQCEDAGCGWLFVDRSNARKRRWCSMADCGNRNKVRNFYRREAATR